MAQEALTNITRHARARHVSMGLQSAGGQLHLAIRDDGVGFDLADMRRRAVYGKSMGLLSMEERAKLGGGLVHIDSAPGRGTTVTLTVPYSASAPPY